MALSMVGSSIRTLTYAGAHTHAGYEVILNRAGSGTITIGDEAYPFFPGSIHIIPPHVPHIKRSEEGFFDLFLQTDMLYPNTMLAQKRCSFVLRDDAQHTLETMMELMFSRYCAVSKTDPVLQSMYELVLRLLDEFCATEMYDPLVQGLVHRITLSFHDPEFSVSALLRQSGYQADHIRRIFTAATGMTPKEYLTDIRISYAKKLLREQDQSHSSIADIGVMCGYTDAKYFSRIFRSATGLTPSDFAAQYRCEISEKH